MTENSGEWERELVTKLATAALKEQRRARLWGIFFKLLTFAYLSLILLMAIDWKGADVAGGRKHTAMVEVNGIIAPGSDASAERINSALQAAFKDKNTQGVIVRINSPGGSPVQSGIVNDEIRRLKAKHHKKVYAVVEEMCASGAYYIAVAADEIYVDKASVVGSIGVLMDGFGFTRLMDKIGVERRLFTAGDNKAMLDPFSPLSDKHAKLAQALIEQVHGQFIAVVREGRGKRLKETEETFSGLFWNGEEAVRLGLVDAFGNLDYVAREVVKAEEIVDYTPHDNIAERLAKRLGASMGAGAVKALREMAPLR